jgi:8-oxo-dGTP diphosphatase
LVKISEVHGGDDAARAQWFSLKDVPQLAFDHDMILREAMKYLRQKIHFEPVGFELLPEVFTMPQLQNLYESILDVHFDRRNFAAKMLQWIQSEKDTRQLKTAIQIYAYITREGEAEHETVK